MATYNALKIVKFATALLHSTDGDAQWRALQQKELVRNGLPDKRMASAMLAAFNRSIALHRASQVVCEC